MNSPLVQIDGHESVPENDENALMKAVANQPVSVAIDAGGKDFQFYSEASFVKILIKSLNSCFRINFNFLDRFNVVSKQEKTGLKEFSRTRPVSKENSTLIARTEFSS